MASVTRLPRMLPLDIGPCRQYQGLSEGCTDRAGHPPGPPGPVSPLRVLPTHPVLPLWMCRTIRYTGLPAPPPARSPRCPLDSEVRGPSEYMKPVCSLTDVPVAPELRCMMPRTSTASAWIVREHVSHSLKTVQCANAQNGTVCINSYLCVRTYF